MRVRCVCIVVVITVGSAVAEGAVGEVAFDECTSCAGGVVEIPAPGAADEVEGASGLVGGEVAFDFEGLTEAD